MTYIFFIPVIISLYSLSFQVNSLILLRIRFQGLTGNYLEYLDEITKSKFNPLFVILYILIIILTLYTLLSTLYTLHSTLFSVHFSTYCIKYILTWNKIIKHFRLSSCNGWGIINLLKEENSRFSLNTGSLLIYFSMCIVHCTAFMRKD